MFLKFLYQIFELNIKAFYHVKYIMLKTDEILMKIIQNNGLKQQQWNLLNNRHKN